MSKRIDVIGQRFGQLVVIGETESKVHPNGRRTRMMICKCDCGNEKVVSIESLRSGHTISCGCYREKRRVEANITHGLRHSRLYDTYQHMKGRCYNPNDKRYYRYGARGIKICDEWMGENGFITFYNWAMANGYDDSLTIDRIDNNGNYEPSNCRWATYKEQENNMSRNVYYECNGESHTVSEWSDITGIDKNRIYSRIKSGWSIEDAITKPPVDNSKPVEVFKDGQTIGVFKSISKAAEFTDVHTSAISQCLNGKTKTANGYTFRRV